MSYIPSFEYVLNRQTAYNRKLVTQASRCGCFNCCTFFEPPAVTRWLDEDKEAQATALCPHCGVDTVIVGTEDYPLDFELLCKLQRRWFPREYRHIAHRRNSQDQLRLIPTYIADTFEDDSTPINPDITTKREEGKRALYITDLSPLGLVDCSETEGFIYVERPDERSTLATGRVDILLMDGNIRFRDRRGDILPFEPWSGTDVKTIERLVERYGSALYGMKLNTDTDPFGAGSIVLIVDENLAQ